MLTQLFYLETLNTRQLISPTLCSPRSFPAEGITLVFAHAVKQYKCLVHSGKLSRLKLKKYLFPNIRVPGM